MTEQIQLKEDQVSILKDGKVSDFLSSMDSYGFGSKVYFELPSRWDSSYKMMAGDYLIEDRWVNQSITNITLGENILYEFLIYGRQYLVRMIKTHKQSIKKQ